MFNIILDDLPSIYPHDRSVRINTDFRQGLKYFRNIGDKELSDRRRASNIIYGIFQTLPRDVLNGDKEAITKMWEYISWYISGGVDPEGSESGPPVFDFNVDSGRLYSSFMQTYKIDLRSVKMHWWCFLELFRSIPEDTALMKVIDIRSKPIPKDADAVYRAQLAILKQKYVIDPEEYIKRQNAAEDAAFERL